MEENPTQCPYQACTLLLIKKYVCGSKKGLLEKLKHTTLATVRESLSICRIILKNLCFYYGNFQNI